MVMSTWLDSEAPRAVNVAPRTTCERRSVFEREAVKPYARFWALRFWAARR